MKVTKRFALAVAACAFYAALVPAFAVEPAEIVTTMEKKMYPDSKTAMTLESTYDGVNEKYVMTSFARDNNQKIIVRFSAPATIVGSDLLMLDRNVWLFDPKSGREMKIPSNQSFGGTGFSYGDVLRLNFSDNYTPVLASEDATAWTLELTAKERDAPYNRITLVVAKDFTPVSGKCFTRSGELVKEMKYSLVADAGGGKKPLVITVTSPLDAKDKSVLTITKETPKSYPENIFNKKNLSARLEESF
jgi:outer membrane lipoprotein-sorting protein